MENQKFIFIDRDGVINKDYVDYVYTIDKLEFLDDSINAINALYVYGYKVIVITNQSGIARGVYTEEDMKKIHKYMVKTRGARIEAFYHCPHDPKKEDCKCRKPKPGMLLQAARDYNINLSETYFIGDWITDIQCGKVAGCKTILVRTGRGKRAEQLIPDEPNYIVDNLFQAAEIVIKKKYNIKRND